jgi:5-methylcytosine-specific restriction endonuclease McrA
VKNEERTKPDALQERMRQAAAVYGWGGSLPTEVSPTTGRELSPPKKQDPRTVVLYRYRDYEAALRAYHEEFDRRGLMLREVDDDFEMVDDGPVQWTAEHYRALIDLHGKLAYYRTRHWKQVSQMQRARFSTCNRCGRLGAEGVTLDAHHLNGYGCVGNEKVGVDLETLCRKCHDGEHRPPQDTES